MECIGRNKFSCKEIKQKELEICKSLQWNMWISTPLTFLKQYIINIAMKHIPNISDSTLSKVLKTIEVRSELICMQAMYDSDIIGRYSYNLIASACIMLTVSYPFEASSMIELRQEVMRLLAGDGLKTHRYVSVWGISGRCK